MVSEIKDRFGPPPKEVLNLFSVIKIKIGLKKIGSTRLDVKDGYMIFSFSKDTHLSPPELGELVARNPENFCLLSDRKLKVISRRKGSFATLKEAGEITAQFDQYRIKD
jgi:transcription-repair coupling factor (superfamily II helicase)